MGIKKFTNEAREAQKMWREANFKTLSEDDLLFMDTEMVKYNKVDTRRDLFRWLVYKKAARWIHGSDGQIAVRPDQYESEMHNLEQWGRWRERKFPSDMRVAYEKIAAEKGRMMAAAKAPEPEKAGTVVPHGTAGGEFAYPADEINPDDIPF